jgi:UDP-2-acetamido-2-deoxy-ribo-hexuluronate aminotransferase
MSATRKIPFFDYPKLFLDQKEELIRVFEEVGSRGAYIMQQDLVNFEKRLSGYINSNYAIGVGNATDGLELAWLAIGLKKGDEVIVSSHTMVATASAIVTAGGTPVPVDIGDDNLIDPEAILSAITKNTVGISPTQLNGRTCKMDLILDIAKKQGLKVVEDSAQALGSKYKGKNAGTFGDAASFSFFPAKVLGCFGDGGGVVTNDKEIYEKIFQLHDHGRDTHGEIKSWGRNSRLDNLQAAILNKKFETYDEVIRRRREIANIYDSRLSILEELTLPPAPSIDTDHFDVYQNYEFQAKNRNGLRDSLLKNGIGTLIQWGGKGIHQWEVLGFNVRLPRTEKFFDNCLMIPINAFITDEDAHYVCDKIIEFYRSK